MSKLIPFVQPALVLLLAATFLTAGQAQSVVFVSAKTGADGNPCTLAAPCRSLTFAHSTVAANGRIVVMDSGDYSDLNITKSVTVEAAPGIAAVITNPVAATTIAVNAGSGDKIVLRGLHLKGSTPSNSFGLRIASGASLLMERCVVEGFSTNGILITSAANFALHHSSVRHNSIGIGMGLASSGAQSATIDNCLIDRNSSHGISLSPVSNAKVNAIVRNTKIANNGGNGLRGIADVVDSQVNCLVENVTIVGNSIGIRAERSVADFFVSKSTIVGNITGLSTVNFGKILTALNNTVEGNTSNGSFTESYVVE
jgi:Right handed beta helix region